MNFCTLAWMNADHRRPRTAAEYQRSCNYDYLIMGIKTLNTLVLLGLFLTIARAQSFSNLKEDELLGNVKTVRTEQTWTTKENDKYVESEKTLMKVENYDKNGNKTEWLGYFGKENPMKIVFVCEDKGRITEELFYNSVNKIDVKTIYKYSDKGNLIEEIISNGIKVVYSYDSKNNKKSERTYDLVENEGGRAFGSVGKIVYFHYYKNNKLKEIGSYNFDGSRIWNPQIQAHKIVYAYDSKGQIAFTTFFNQDNSVRSKTRYIYDSTGILVKEFSFVSEDKTTYIYNYTYEFDEPGNWIRQKKSKQIGKKNKVTFIPIETIYRTINYH